jgi:hypothetical protein
LFLIPYAYTLIGKNISKGERERDHHYFSIFARQHCCRFVHLRTLHFLVCLWTNAHIERELIVFLIFFCVRTRERLYENVFCVDSKSTHAYFKENSLCERRMTITFDGGNLLVDAHKTPRSRKQKKNTISFFFIDNLFSYSSSRSSFSFSLLHVRY